MMQPDTTDPAINTEACFPGYPPKKDAAEPVPPMEWHDIQYGLARQIEAHAALRGAADRLLTRLHSRAWPPEVWDYLVPQVIELQAAVRR